MMDTEERIAQATDEINETLSRYNLSLLVELFTGSFFLLPSEDIDEADEKCRKIH